MLPNSDKPALTRHGANVYSQDGEDGILAHIFETIGVRSHICVEFGAWDGFYLSNTANLWTKGWRGILIEANEERFVDLQRNIAAHNVKAIQGFVRHEGEDTLERILRREGITETPDLVAIDIDGDDYHIFASLNELRPRVIICEYNPTVPPHMDLVAEPGNYFGASALAMVRLAEKKGYALVACTETNLIFVQQEYFDLFREYDTNLESIFVPRHLVNLITGFGGDYLLSREPPYGFTTPTKQAIRGEFYAVPPPRPQPSVTFREQFYHFRMRLLRRLRIAGPAE